MDLYRTTYVRKHFFGLESVQDYLELAKNYKEGSVNLVCDKNDETKYESVLFNLKQLEKDEVIITEWEDYVNERIDGWVLKQVSLTVKGHKLLDECVSKSKFGSLKTRITNLFWVVITAICSTLIVLQVKGI